MSLPRIAVDAMGGDEGVRVMVEGAALARRRHDRFKFLLVGDEARIKAALDNHPNLRAASEIIHTDGVVDANEKPAVAIRKAKSTSMGLAINAVKQGQAGAAVSALHSSTSQGSPVSAHTPLMQSQSGRNPRVDVNEKA